MKWYVDLIFRAIDKTVHEIDHELASVLDEEASASRYARQGAIISDERWASIEKRQRELDNQKMVLQLLKSTLFKHHIPRNSNKDKVFYQKIIEEDVLKVLESHENFEGCAFVQKFMQEFV